MNKLEMIERSIKKLEEKHKEYQNEDKYSKFGVYYCDGFCDGLDLALQELEKLKDE